MKKLIIGNKYKWKGDLKILVYQGKKGNFHQFGSERYPSVICCELLNSYIQFLEQSQ